MSALDTASHQRETTPTTRRRAARRTRLAPPEWLYRTVYPGGGDRMDAGVRELVVPARKLALDLGVEQWFFIRYLDQLGPHLRIRFRGSREALDRLELELDPLLHAGLRRVAASTPDLPSALLSTEVRPLDGLRDPAVRGALYEPELRKYGGPRGVRIAERVFARSSEAALALLHELHRPEDRAVASLAAMDALAADLLAGDARRRFWLAYSRFWLGSVRALPHLTLAPDWQLDARRRAATLRAATGAAASGSHAAPIAELRAALADARQEAASAGVALQPPHALFHHLHMTNNRLGTSPPEEAVLARLLADEETDR